MLFAAAHVLKMHKLKKDIEQLIVKEYLTPATAIFYLTEAIRFSQFFLKEEALKLLVREFPTAIQVEENRNMLLRLPF